MILSGDKIREAVESGDIDISNFDKKLLNPNSYNIHLHNEIATYDDPVLYMNQENKITVKEIPEEGMLLLPNELYLARTAQKTTTYKYVPMLDSRSSVSRLGVQLHMTGGFGDVGFNGYWTLEITVKKPIWIFPNVEIGQLYFFDVSQSQNEIDGLVRPMTYRNGKYQSNDGIQTSKLWKDFQND